MFPPREHVGPVQSVLGVCKCLSEPPRPDAYFKLLLMILNIVEKGNCNIIIVVIIITMLHSRFMITNLPVD